MTVGQAPPARLFTTFGTTLYVDPSGELTHGPTESSPANVVFTALGKGSGQGRSGSIVHIAGDEQEPVICTPEFSRVVSAFEGKPSPGFAITLELISVERGLIALKAGGKYLMADPSGRLSLSSAVCSTWECFLASEAWCSAADRDALPPTGANQTQFNAPAIKRYVVNPATRAASGRTSPKKKILICTYPQWGRGRFYYDLCTQLHRKGYVVDALDLDAESPAVLEGLLGYYDLVLTSIDNVPGLADDYGVAYEKMIAVTHHEMDVRFLIESKGAEVFERFAAYGAASAFAYAASLVQGVRRPPRVTPPGIDYAEFYAETPTRLETVGYVSPMSAETFGVEWKRGHLSKAAAEAAGMPFKLAGPNDGQSSFHDMPGFYRSVDAVLTSSLTEVAQLPVMEAAAAGRLVIGTPVGHFPLRAYQGGGILAPIEPDRFVAFAAETLRHYRDHPSDFVFKCLAVQEAAQQFDWKHCIDAWVELIESA